VGTQKHLAMMAFLLTLSLFCLSCFFEPVQGKDQEVERLWTIQANRFVEDLDTIVATGGVSVSIDKQDSELTADCVVYDKKVRILRTIGNVRILRRDQLTTGQRFDFRIASDEYLVTEPNVSVGEPLLKVQTPTVNDSKKSRGSK